MVGHVVGTGTRHKATGVTVVAELPVRRALLTGPTQETKSRREQCADRVRSEPRTEVGSSVSADFSLVLLFALVPVLTVKAAGEVSLTYCAPTSTMPTINGNGR